MELQFSRDQFNESIPIPVVLILKLFAGEEHNKDKITPRFSPNLTQGCVEGLRAFVRACALIWKGIEKEQI